MIFCVDTSVINRLHRLKNANRVIEDFLAANDVYISCLNLIEIGRTPDNVLREELRATAKRLAKDFRPLELPNHLVQQLCLAFQHGYRQVSWDVSPERNHFWVALSEPNSLGEN